MSLISPETGHALSIPLNTADSTTPEIKWLGVRVATIFIPTGSTITSLTYYAAEKSGGTYLPLQTSSGSAVTQTVAQTKAYDMPAALAGVHYLKIVANAAGAVHITYKGL